VESGYRINAISPKGAIGLLQLMPTTASWVAKKYGIKYRSDLDPIEAFSDPKVNLKIGIAYLAELRKMYDGNPMLVLAAYNAGPGRVDQWIKSGKIKRNSLGNQKIFAYFENVRKGFYFIKSEKQINPRKKRTRSRV
jgi:soluble lytic murein transglycosylase